MKVTKFFITAAIVGIMLTGCSKDEPKPYSDYFGKWKWTVDGEAAGWIQVTLTADKAILETSLNVGYIIEDLTWTPKSNPTGIFYATYSTGYRITGKLTAINGTSMPKADGSGFAALGDIVSDWWYISTDKKSICQGTPMTDNHEACGGPFVKQ